MELIPLKPDQHLLTFVPKLTAELPFFNLTTYQRNLPTVIKFKGVDNAGHPINWEVYQNTNAEIGTPRADAHRAWYQLVKPAADECRRANGIIPQIIPLGRIRECLRKIGWTAGGHQERKLIRSLNQIGAAWCVADLWIPTSDVDDYGRPKYVQVKGRFSRLSVYAIGERHVTEDELVNLTFNFDLDDVLYIKLDPLEATMQQAPDQRIYDNEYWFSVAPAARRWYELMAPKIFGTIKNNASFCEIRYSWYIAHHHTLKRFYERRRVVEQMNRLIADHLESHYVEKVEYRAIKEMDQEIDYIIRYYPGPGAEESNDRIQTYIRDKRSRRKLRAVPRALKQGSQEADVPLRSSALSVITTDYHELVSQLMTNFGISPLKACELVVRRKEAVSLQLEAWPFRGTAPRNPAGWLIQAIENNYDLPTSYLEEKERSEQRLLRDARKKAIGACRICDDNGYRRLKAPGDFHGRMRSCTHDPHIEIGLRPNAQN